VIAWPPWDEGGAPEGIIESVRDVTERVRAEDAEDLNGILCDSYL
jgi:hypothetical protein